MTATHQLKTAVTSIAFVGRSLFFTSLSTMPMESTIASGSDSYADLLMISLSNALLGMDANDPPKTLATMQLLGSLFSNVRLFTRDICSIMHNNFVFGSYLLFADVYCG